MIQKGKIGPQVFWGISLLVIPLWLTAFPETTIKHNANDFFIYSGQITGLLGFSLFAITFILAARIRWLESYFGGLDKMYHTHHQMAKIALLLLMLHPILLASRWITEDLSKALWYIFGAPAISHRSWELVIMGIDRTHGVYPCYKITIRQMEIIPQVYGDGFHSRGYPFIPTR